VTKDKNDERPAFPRIGTFKKYTRDLEHYNFSGMSLREWYAGKAMQAMVISGDKKGKRSTEELARAAYGLADAMIKEGKKET